MVNVIDNESRKRANMMPVGIKVVDNKGNAVHTAKTDLGTNYISLEQKWFGSSSNNNDGNTDPDNPDHPSAGADYYAGSLADGEITQRTLKWEGTDDPSKSNKITFSDDPGTNFYGQFTGITMLAHVQKQVMTKGVLGDISTLPINYDTANEAKTGYYTTVASYPIYAKSASFPVGQKVAIPFNGIGEGLSGKNTKAPIVYFTYNADKTMTIEHEAGYDNDGASDGATGANYQVVIELIATFSTQNAVAQLPASVNLFSGSASGDIVTVGPSEYYENIMDGLEITFDQYATAYMNNQSFGSNNGPQHFRFDASKAGLSKIRIPKEYLICENIFDFSNQIGVIGDDLNTYETSSNNISWYPWGTKNVIINSVDNTKVNIKANGLLNLGFNVILLDKERNQKVIFALNIAKVTTYKK